MFLGDLFRLLRAKGSRSCSKTCGQFRFTGEAQLRAVVLQGISQTGTLSGIEITGQQQRTLQVLGALAPPTLACQTE